MCMYSNSSRDWAGSAGVELGLKSLGLEVEMKHLFPESLDRSQLIMVHDLLILTLDMKRPLQIIT